MSTDSKPLNTATSKPGKTELAEMFRKFIDPQFVITDEETLKPYECDGLSMYCVMPLLVLLPETVEQVQQVMRLCHRFGIPVVARGAGTGLSAGAMPDAGGVVLSLAKFNRILHIDPLARSARLQSGVRNLAISGPPPTTVSTTAQTPPPRSPAPSAAMSVKTPAVCIALNTG